MPYETCATAPYVIPSKSAAGVSKVPADSWATGTWTEITADSGAADLLLLQLITRITTAAYGSSSVWEIGVGGAGAETVVASWRVKLSAFAYNTAFGNYALALPVLIAAHSRIAVRARGGPFYGSAPTCSVLIGVQPAPDPLTIEIAPGPGKVTAQTAATPTTTANTTAWAWSSWLELLASAPSDIVLAGWTDYLGQAGSAGTFDVELQFGVGAAGAETPLTTLVDTCSNSSSKSHWGSAPFAVLHAVAAGSRVAARLRKTGTATLTWGAGLSYFEVAP